MHNVTECQVRLIDLGFLPALNAAGKSNADGIGGQHTLDALNEYLASLGRPQITRADFTLTRMNAELWPDEVPPAPIHRPTIFDQLGLLLSIFNLLKGKTMTADQITGVIRAIIAAVSGFLVAKGWGDADFWTWVGAGVTAIVPVIWTWISNRPKTIVPLSQKLGQ